MEINLLFFLCVVPAIIIFGIAKSGLGGSIALISIPLMTVVMPLTEALAIILPILILSDFTAVYKFRKEFDLDTLKLIVPFAAIGIFIGSITFSHYFLFKRNKIIPTKKSFLKGSISSTVAGFTSFCVHAGGTPTSIYLLPLRLKKEIYVGTRVIFFTFVNLIKFPFYIHLSMVTLESFKQSLILFPLSVVGILIGYQILKYVEESLFYNIIYILILITSSRLVYSYIF